MVRVHTGVAHHKRVKKLLKRAKGFRGQRSKNLRSAKHTLLRAGAFAYAHRRSASPRGGLKKEVLTFYTTAAGRREERPKLTPVEWRAIAVISS